MQNPVLAVAIASALAGCAVCAEPYATAPYAMTEEEAEVPAPVRATRPSEPRLLEADKPARSSKTQSQ